MCVCAKHERFARNLMNRDISTPPAHPTRTRYYIGNRPVQRNASSTRTDATHERWRNFFFFVDRSEADFLFPPPPPPPPTTNESRSVEFDDRAERFGKTLNAGDGYSAVVNRVDFFSRLFPRQAVKFIRSRFSSSRTKAPLKIKMYVV